MQSNTPKTEEAQAPSPHILRQWLNDRGITNEVIDQFGVTAHEHPSIGECIRIPITETHSKYRRHPLDDRKPKYLYDSGAKVTLYGASFLFDVPDAPVVITEGELDTLVCWSQNIPAVSSTGGAMSFQAEWAEVLSGREVYVAFDNDDAGAEGTVKVLEVLPHARVVLVPETPGVKDISDYVARGGNVHDLVATAVGYDGVTAVEADRKRRAATWQSVRFHDKYLAKHREKHERASARPNPYTGDDKVLRAKSYPMDRVVAFTRRKACCLWHNEKTGSLHYYPKTNTAYCFGGCGRSYDVIDAYMKVHGVTFLEAVRALNDMV